MRNDDDDVLEDILAALAALGGFQVLPSDMKMSLEELASHLVEKHGAPKKYIAEFARQPLHRELRQLHLSRHFNRQPAFMKPLTHKHRGWTR